MYKYSTCIIEPLEVSAVLGSLSGCCIEERESLGMIVDVHGVDLYNVHALWLGLGLGLGL